MSSRLLEVSPSDQVVTVDKTLRTVGTFVDEVKTVCIVGPTRTGKSFLLNYLAGQQKCFRVENGGCVTKGVDIINKPVMLNQIPTYLVDVEGMGDKSASYDFKLCLPVLAVADVILLNVRGQPGRNDMLNLLNRFVYMYERVCKGSQVGTGQFLLPHLILVMRDWTNRVGYETEYLAKLMSTEPNDNDAVVNEQNEIRKTIKKCFQSVDMVTLPLPTSQDVLESNEELKFHQLTGKFIDKIVDLKQMVADKLSSPTATIFGNKFGTAGEFVNNLKKLASEVNSSEFHLPSMVEAMKAYHLGEVERKMAFWAKYQCPLPLLPRNPSDLHTELQSRYTKATREFQRCSNRLGLGIEAEKKFLWSLEGIHKELEDENDRKILDVCETTGEKFLDAKRKNNNSTATDWQSEYTREVQSAFNPIGVKMVSTGEFPAVLKWLKRVATEEESAKRQQKEAEERQKLCAEMEKLKIAKAEEERRRIEAESAAARSINSGYGGYGGYSSGYSSPPVMGTIYLDSTAAQRSTPVSTRSSSSASNRSSTGTFTGGYSARGHALFTGSRGGTYHMSSGGNKVYHKK